MRIREVIEEQGITTKEVAKKLGISLSALNQHISGNPSVKVLAKISEALNVPMWQFFASEKDVIPQEDNTVTCPNCGTRLKVTKE
jgi:transcriptional regulator with XRE-family HTH domain